MITTRIKFVIEDIDRHGNVRVYFRKRGHRKIRLPDPVGSEAFWEAYRKAAAGEIAPKVQDHRKAPTGSLKWLCEAYFQSAEFKTLDIRTRRVRRLVLDHICQKHGEKPFVYLETRHVRAWRDAVADRPEAANQLVKFIRQVFKVAIANDLAKVNPAIDVPYLASKGDGWHTWTLEEVAAFERCHTVGTMARLALAILLYTGQRRADVVAFGRQHIDGNSLTFTQNKNRNRKPVKLTIPILPALRSVIDATPARNLTFLTTAFGRPFTADGFGNRFRKWCREAGIADCSPHGLRKAGATVAAENGATEHQLMAIFGWRTLKEVQRYTKGARQKKLAESGMHLLMPEQGANESVPLSKAIKGSGTISRSKLLK